MKKFTTIILLLITACLCPAQDAQLEAAKKKIESKDFTGAKADLTKIITANPRNKIALNLRGLAQISLNDFYGAIGDFNFALEVDSTYSEALEQQRRSKDGLR